MRRRRNRLVPPSSDSLPISPVDGAVDGSYSAYGYSPYADALRAQRYGVDEGAGVPGSYSSYGAENGPSEGFLTGLGSGLGGFVAGLPGMITGLANPDAASPQSDIQQPQYVAQQPVQQPQQPIIIQTPAATPPATPSASNTGLIVAGGLGLFGLLALGATLVVRGSGSRDYDGGFDSGYAGLDADFSSFDDGDDDWPYGA